MNLDGRKRLNDLKFNPLKIGIKRFIKKSEFEMILDEAAIDIDKSDIPIREVYKHLGGKEKYPTKPVIQTLCSRIRRLIQHGVVQGDKENKVVDIESLKKYIEFESNILENYMSVVEFHELLGTSMDINGVRIKEFFKVSEAEFSFDYVETEFPIYNRTFFISKSSVERFLRDYISMNEVESIVSKSVVSKSEFGWQKTLKRLEINPLKIGIKRFIKKSEFEMILDDDHVRINESDYYTLAEFKQILSLTKVNDSLAIEKDYDLKPKILNGLRKFYKKDLVDDLKLQQTELRKKYISLQEAEELAAAEGFIFNAVYIEGEPVDSLLRPFLHQKKNMYSKETFNNWLEERKKNLTSIQYQWNPILIRLNIGRKLRE